MTSDPEILPLFDEASIADRVAEMAREIAADRPERLLVVAVLKGSFMFAADLVRALHRAGLELEMEFIHLSSYGAGTESREIRVLRDVESDVAGRDVILVDDILESGRTLTFARDRLTQRGARSVRVAALLDKPSRRKSAISAEYVGFECPDRFVVGYGMDMGHKWRQLPFIGHVVQETAADADA
ncbi:MAG: hypoxanthine phosphoribosyltransferase [Stappia sp.]|uniref:hypoxanthine phosphoribosyltransferase n=1 Tax=Stappia sp. TaxID=1870903 RepID=UPI000C3B086C|nr:hypoxanthine phosphoribosyltransferase [Stappia sp.]MAA99444.1 hypoxanthine phosphoribosyltransferase [Stappia sp.]MBM20381.1 hypoxanthine phosphoribosyltransferase [Stappia sp.]|tara:strand:- start:649 stop:1203 length:555 start_codon:yes stop_codon:yes gene_type:complete